jgi:uncharacterized protein YcbK (DUF882 family)
MDRASDFAAVLPRTLGTVLIATFAAGLLASPVAPEVAPVRPRAAPDASRKHMVSPVDAPLLGTLVDTHSPARLPLDELSPAPPRFEALLADPLLGTTHPVDPALLNLTRSLARAHPLARIEVVSGFRSPKLNEALRKKGHHVASHSQHSLGNALDFRVVPAGTDTPIDPQVLAAEVRGLGWAGGVGVYLQPNDRFVHADVGPLRTWYGQ